LLGLAWYDYGTRKKFHTLSASKIIRPIINAIWARRWRLIWASIVFIVLLLSSLFWASETFWEDTEYAAEAIVLLGCLGEFLTEYEHVLRGESNAVRRHRLARACAIILMAGIAVELMALVRTNELFTGTIAVLNKEAGDARLDAGHAVERAGIANREAGIARLDASNANGLAEKYQAQIADSNARVKVAEATVAVAKADVAVAVAKVATADARTAEAQRGATEAEARAQEAHSMAEAEKLERVRLEAIVEPRSISVADQRTIAVTLSRFSGKRVSVTTYSLDGEGAALGKQIVAMLLTARIDVDDRTASVTPMGGFNLGVHVTGTLDDLVVALRGALSVIGHLVVAPPNTPTANPTLELVPKGPVDANILIGIKPVPIIR
jgi:hypothetical protein